MAANQPQELAVTWQYLAWRMWCAGTRNYAGIHRALTAQGYTLPKDASNCVRRAIARESKLAAKDLAKRDIDPEAEYIAGLEEDFADADKLLRTGDNANARLGGLKLKVELREKLAAAKGVVTRREGREHSGTLAVAAVDVSAVVSNEAAAEAAAALLAAIAAGDNAGPRAADAGGAGPGDGTVPVPAGAAPESAEPPTPAPGSGPDAPPDGDNAAAPREE
jgi:hypothetical protein